MGETDRPDTSAAAVGDQRHNHLAAAEMGEEGNYNMIDGVINNAKPSILEFLRQHKPQPNERGNNPDRSERPGEREK